MHIYNMIIVLDDQLLSVSVEHLLWEVVSGLATCY